MGVRGDKHPSPASCQLRLKEVKNRSAPQREATHTSTAAGKCFLDMLGVFAEFETNLRRERQLEGIAKAKAAGVYKHYCDIE
jgi:DNA invertase Pin-like site-specific DNA recombinase